MSYSICSQCRAEGVWRRGVFRCKNGHWNGTALEQLEEDPPIPVRPKHDCRTYAPDGTPTHKTIVLTAEQYDIFLLAWDKMLKQDGQGVTKGQAVERCCAEYLSGATDE